MARKVNSRRVWGLIKWIALTISGLALLLFIILLTGENDFNRNMNVSSCLGYPKGIINACIEDVLKTTDSRNSLYKYSLVLGIGLPTVIFGGRWLFKHITTDKE